MVKLTSPYNFVPLNKCVYIPDWAEKVSQDIPFEDGEDGWIEVTWKNVSPLIVRNASTKEDPSPVHFTEADGKKLYFIPGTSMKGMLRSILEILSFGKMDQYGNRFFGHREFNTKQPEGRAYRDEMNNVKWGWLRKDNDDLFLSPCVEDVVKKNLSEIEKDYRNLKDKTSQWERNKYIAERNNGEMFPETEDGFRLYCTGKMHNKKHELLIPTATEEEEKLTDDMREEFLTVHAQTPDFEKFTNLLDNGKMIPVSYIKKDGELVAVGLSRMLKLPYTKDVKTLVKNEQETVKGKDLCETIFGFIGKTSKDESLRGRVQVSHAFCKTDGKELLDEVSGVLGEPKPSFYPLYLKQTTSPYKTYNNAEGIAGRKLYRVHTGESVLTLPGGNENDNVKTHFRPLRPGLSFVMRINLHNMRPVEIGAILSALTLHNTKDAWHNLGGAKSFGYGKMECVTVDLKGLKHQKKEEYMRAFEEEMECFTREKLRQKWSETEQVKALVGILSEHSDADVRMMTLEEYGRVSKEPFQKLNEGNRALTSLLPEDLDKKYKKKIFIDEHKGEYEKAKKLEEEGKLHEAINVYNELIKQLDIEGLSTDEERKIIEEINAAIEKKKEEKEEEERAARNARRAQGLAAQLEAKYDDGRYKRDTVKKALAVADTWLKHSEQTELTDDEKKDLYSTLKRLKDAPHKDDRNLWNDRDKKGWERIKKFIGEDLTEMLKTGDTTS